MSFQLTSKVEHRVKKGKESQIDRVLDVSIREDNCVIRLKYYPVCGT
ncbi:hypothetical protein QL112_013070 [Xenorhabdus griffiniae]|uniref:Transposase n=1 Tax=Xenorhabdus griffiniae TaxID=351672 RepID=A0ABY9XDX6_9GAMM|nr:hypothetical protein [Xenorhabdus griffiniae]MBD1226200.1 hypothetical protein [Xenorhabdus griffiniae]WMV71121.1 hypothetical protein QL128_13065 [Xenorhabdus griffiniae]WNH00797.1 hypothetical protein QL112_013070 [Xenorhabdus griffiniae]